MQPAHKTKNIPVLLVPFQSTLFSLNQLDNGLHNGTAIWLAGQALALTLPSILRRKGKAIELGSGIGFTALALCSLGWDVLATDAHAVVSSVLKANIDRNRHILPPGSGSIEVRELNWTVPPQEWLWAHPRIIASMQDISGPEQNDPSALLCPPFDLILTADTIYSPDLVAPLLRTLSALSAISSSPPIYLALERRDSRLSDDAFRQARDVWNFSVQRVAHKKVARAMSKGCTWDTAEWEGVEIWKLALRLNTQK